MINKLLLSNSQSDVNLRIDGSTSDAHDSGSRRVQKDDTLVDAHLVGVPSLGTLTVGGLTRGDLEDLGRQTDGATGSEVLLLRTGQDVLGDTLDALHRGGTEGDPHLHGGFFLLRNLVAHFVDMRCN